MKPSELFRIFPKELQFQAPLETDTARTYAHTLPPEVLLSESLFWFCLAEFCDNRLKRNEVLQKLDQAIADLDKIRDAYTTPKVGDKLQQAPKLEPN